ncbi:ABC transporter ATP-binding protein [Roseibium aggregatum]|uniref:ABC transporter ATP-binding protein n=1 Tax=Roseibium aggregatum TaxID=187304 RepID=UPI0025AD634F|nr:ABC transporter ATP-binding protein [Roseibium aggregatum]WJS05471.1 ABC transporter ATP-binding protein [Roseibium aggregatum]
MSEQSGTRDPLLQVNEAGFDYKLNRGLFQSKQSLRAVEGASFSLDRSQTLVVIGESGSGKTSLGRMISGDQPPHTGSVTIDNNQVSSLTPMKRARLVQPVVQDPSSVFDPRWRIGRSLEEPLRIHFGPGNYSRGSIEEILEATNLPSSILSRFPHQLSGGQLQRVAIARALLLKPKLLVCDEAVSALDATVQTKILDLLNAIQRDFGTSIVFITHDINLALRIGHRIAVMYLGKIIELGPAELVGSEQSHPYTRALFSAAPQFGRTRGRRATLRGEPPSPVHRPSGCAFHPRCPSAGDICRTQAPQTLTGNELHSISCHFEFKAPDALRIKELAG